MRIDVDEARRIAALARIDFDDAGIERIARELSKILDYIDQLNEVPASPAGKAAQNAPTPLRDDQVRPSLPIEEVERNAPSFAHGFFIVPKIIGGEP